MTKLFVHAAFVLRLTRRLARSRELAQSAAIVLVAGLFLTSMFIVLRTLSLSGDQVVQRDLGRFGASVGYGSIVLTPGDDQFVPQLRDRADKAGLNGAEVMLSASNTPVATVPPRDVSMLEIPWQNDPYPDRYRLISGRWPEQPGEIVITEPADLQAAPDGTLPILGGKATLKVVGTADDRFASTANLLAAPGTWASFDPDVAKGFPLLGAQPILLWQGNDTPAAVAAFTDAVRAAPPVAADGTANDPGRVEDTLRIREQLAVRPERTGIERSPAGYTLPSLLLPVAVVLLMFGINDQRRRREANRLMAVGVSARATTAALTGSALIWCTGAAIAGILAGTGVGVAARAVIAQVRDRPPGPVEGLVTPALRFVALVMFTCMVAGFATVLRMRQPRMRRIRGKVRPAWMDRVFGRDVRHIAAVVAWCAAALYAAQIDTPVRAMMVTGIVTVAVLFSLPDGVDALLRVLPESGPRRRLARRQLTGDRRRVTAAIAVLTVLIGASLSSLVLVSTMVRSLDAQAYPEVLPGQILLADRASTTFPPPASLVQAVKTSGAASGLDHAQLSYLFTMDSSGEITRSVTRLGQKGNLLAAETPQEVEQLIGHPLSGVQRSTLTGGGLLVWTDAAEPPKGMASARLAITEGDRSLRQTSALPVTSVEVPLVEWRVGTDGIMLSATAQAQQLPSPKSGPQIISGASEAQATAIQQAASRAGLDPRMVRTYTAPPPAVPAAALVVTAAGLALLVLAGVLVATHAQTRTLRSYLSRLIAIGVSPAWARHVLLLQHGCIVATSTLLGLVIALPSTLVLAMRVSGFVLDVPWEQVSVLIAAIYLAALSATLRASFRLRATAESTAGP
jgi:hypothetical protein